MKYFSHFLILICALLLVSSSSLEESESAEIKSVETSIDGSSSGTTVNKAQDTPGEEKVIATEIKSVKKSKNGKKSYDMNSLEKEWEKGDAEEELELEFEHIRKVSLFHG